MEPIVIARAPLSINLVEHTTTPASPRVGQRRLMVRAAIGYYAYTIITPSPDDGVHIVWAACPSLARGLCGEQTVPEAVLSLPETISKQLGTHGLSVFLAPQVPPGSGLGVIGSLAVSMIKGLAYCSGVDLEPAEVAELASDLQIELLKTPAASVEPFAAAYGGLNSMELLPNRVNIQPLRLAPEIRQTLEKSLMLFRLGSLRRPPSPITPPVADVTFRDTLGSWRDGTRDLSVLDIPAMLENGDIETFGQSLHHFWLKAYEKDGHDRNAWMDECYRIALTQGALGGWHETAAGHSFLALCCQEEHQSRVAQVLITLGLKQWPLSLVSDGVEVLEAVPRNWTKVLASTSLISLQPQHHLS